MQSSKPIANNHLLALVRLHNVSKKFGQVDAVRALDLTIQRGDFFAILGPSGCGKTTLLRMIGGFITPTTGSIEIDGEDVTRLGPEKRRTNMVFQGYGLFPHMTVRQNIAYGLRIAKRPKSEIDQRVQEAIALVHLEPLADRSTAQLSGGQQQRVALARTLIMRPPVLLLDEPLAALDLKLRQAMQEELQRIHDQIGGTFVFVTHDQGEAMALANRIAVMQNGELVQEGSPEEIYAQPATRFVSTFVGEANIFPGRRESDWIKLDAGASFASPGNNGPVTLVIRPEAIQLAGDRLIADICLNGILERQTFLGPYIKYQVALDNGQRVSIHSNDSALRAANHLGDAISIGWMRTDHVVVDD